MKRTRFTLYISFIFFLIVGIFMQIVYLDRKITLNNLNQVLAAKFEKLSKNGNSSCSQEFKDSITAMPENTQLQGSCCSPMNMHRYKEQVEELKKYSQIKEIPSDPYDINVALAKKMIAHYDDTLTTSQQKAYEYAMQNSNEKGPCCCKCWRWYFYGGLAKFLIQNYKFTGEQITEIWNLSDGCGGGENG